MSEAVERRKREIADYHDAKREMAERAARPAPVPPNRHQRRKAAAEARTIICPDCGGYGMKVNVTNPCKACRGNGFRLAANVERRP